jgi:hypothetical protein
VQLKVSFREQFHHLELEDKEVDQIEVITLQILMHLLRPTSTMKRMIVTMILANL